MRGSAWHGEEGAAVQELPLWSGMFPTPGKNTEGCSISNVHEGTLPSSSHPPPPSSVQGHVQWGAGKVVGRRLENPQGEGEREWLRETRRFRTGHPWGHSGSLQLAKLQIKQGFCLRSDTIMCRIMLVTPGKGDLIPYNVVFDSLTLETVDTSTDWTISKP